MNREEVDRFLAEADDVIADWDGGPDSASWSASGEHEEPEIRGHYGDIPCQDVSRARARRTVRMPLRRQPELGSTNPAGQNFTPSPDSRERWPGESAEAMRYMEYLRESQITLEDWQRERIAEHFGGAPICNCRVDGRDECARHGLTPAQRRERDHQREPIRWLEDGRPMMAMMDVPPLGFIHSHFPFTHERAEQMIDDARAGMTPAWSCATSVPFARALEEVRPSDTVDVFTHHFRLTRIGRGTTDGESYWALVDQLGLAIAGRRYFNNSTRWDSPRRRPQRGGII